MPTAASQREAQAPFPDIFAMLPHRQDSAAIDAAPSRRLAYYASKLPDKETWFQSEEGYRTYKNVPIARTGSQQYRGREIKRNPGYKPEWNIGDDELVTVYRPLEEVTDRAAVASFETKSVLDEHPKGPSVLVDALDEFEGVSKGHVQNVRVGEIMADGETCIIADLHVKHPELNMKIDAGIRDVSCGYTFRLDKDSAGRYIQREIRGNHVAVVPKGRAGSLVGIGDSAEDDLEPKGNTTMPKSTLIALGLHTLAKEASPKDFAAALDAAVEEMTDKKDSEDEKEKKEGADAKAAKDAEEKEAEEKKAAKDAEEKEIADAMAAMDAEDHPKGCRCDAAGCKDAWKAAKDEAMAEFGKDGMTGADADAEVILPESERGKSDFSVGDSAALLEVLKPAIARSRDPKAVAAFKALHKGIRRVQSGVADGAPDPFVAFTKINASGEAADAEEEIPVSAFFNGKSYQEGLRSYNEYISKRQTR